MPRPRRWRWIWWKPAITCFRPVTRAKKLLEVTLTLDEIEALRLKDLLGLEQGEAAKHMNVSQPTFHRLLQEARRKVADALINAKFIRIEGGQFKMAEKMAGRGRRGFGGPPSACICPNCGYQEPKQPGIPCASKKCPRCGSFMTRV